MKQRGTSSIINMENNQHPVWEVYDLYRTARLNVKYYSALLHKKERLNFILELILLCSAPTSAVAGLWFWESDLGKDIWMYFGIIAAFTSVIKPLLALPQKIKNYESLLSGYRTLEHDLHELKSAIFQKQKYDKIEKADYSKALKRKGSLVSKSSDAREDKKLIGKLTEEVNSELPHNQFYVPEV